MSVMRYGPSCEPGGEPISAPGWMLGVTPEPTHTECPGGEHMPGVIGGWDCPCECHRRPSPGRLWQQAEREHPDDMDRLRARYRELMIEHGHLVPAEPGAARNLPCGWPTRTATSSLTSDGGPS